MNEQVSQRTPRGYGLTKQQNFLKGQMAECVVERLFESHGYEILPYGVEKRFPGWLHDRRLDRNSAAYAQIRAAPDFIVKIPRPDGSPMQIVHLEVKFRRDGRVPKGQLERYAHFQDAILVIVSAQRIKANHVPRLQRGAKLVPISELSVLNLDRDLVAHFEQIVQHIFGGHWPHHP